MFCWTLIPAFIALIEVFMLLAMSPARFDEKYNAEVPARPQVVVNVGSDIGSKLLQLEELRQRGNLTEEAYERERLALLGRAE